MKLKVSVNGKGRNKQDPARLTYGWKNKWLTIGELSHWVSQGFAWAGTHFRDGKRCAANASGSNAIVFDFDGELSLQAFWATKVAQEWCCMTYTSASHTQEINRFRAVFTLEGIPLTEAWDHKCIYEWLELELSRELKQEFKDDCGQKPERLWYGNTEAQVKLNVDAFVPACVIASIPIPPQPVFSRGPSDTSDITDLDIRRCIWLLENFIEPSNDGEYNERYVPVTAACAAIGSEIENAWINWVAAGHHGSKASNMDASLKWNGLGDRSGPASLYAIAKRQDPHWTRQLPPELWFGSQQDSGLSFDAILTEHMRCVPKRMFKRK